MPPGIQFHTLSKSDYQAARTCPTKLYYREMKYPSTKDSDPYLKMLAEGGYMVETLAKLMHPGGITLDYRSNPQETAQRTLEALKADSVTLFEATITSGRKLARLDILKKNGNAFDLIEVKAKSIDSVEHFAQIATGKGNWFRNKPKPHAINKEWLPYIEDVAFQTMLLRENFPNAKITPFLCLVDKSKRINVDELPKYFTIERKIDSNGVDQIYSVSFNGDVETLRKDGLLIQLDVSAEVDEVMELVRGQSALFEASLTDDLKKIQGVPRCDCGSCEYRLEDGLSPNGFVECWGPMSSVVPSVLDMQRASAIKVNGQSYVDGLLNQGRASLFDIPLDVLTKKDGSVGAQATRQRIQLEHTRNKTVWYSPKLHEAMQRATYPLHFIDFEASRLAIPPHARMRSYGQVAFQWSCHTQASPSAPLVHSEWLNDRDYWPNAEFVRSLRNQIGDDGTVLTWSPYEGAVLKDVAREMHEFQEADPVLRDWITELTRPGGRLLDMHKLCANYFFHPDMGGRTSIKVVLDALWKSDAGMRQTFEEITGMAGDEKLGPYAALPVIEINGKPEPVVEGTGAVRAYQAMMYGVERDDVATREQWKQVLLQYCKLDTLAMVLIWEYWKRLP